MSHKSNLIPGLHLEFDHHSGLPTKVTAIADGFSIELLGKFELSIGGYEERSATGGIQYRDCVVLEGTHDGTRSPIEKIEENSIYIPIEFGAIKALIKYEFDSYGSTVSISTIFHKHEALVRNLTLDLGFNLGNAHWLINAPGNGLRSHVPASELLDSVGISPLGGLRGSSAVAHLYNGSNSLAIWSDNLIEIPEILFGPVVDGILKYFIKSNFASDLSKVDDVEVDLLTIDCGRKDWEQFSRNFQEWLIGIGLRSPANPPAWIKNCMIYEVQVGFSVFGEVNKYSPYPTVRDVIEDLPRIESLGFGCLQIMPKQPFPSYNVHDYYDISTSYGDADDLKELIKLCHDRGIKVILDVLLHGVLDKEIIKVAADGVRNGPLAKLIKSQTGDSFSSDVKDWSNYAIAWSRHIIDFEPYWSSGSPDRTTLEDSNPEWFYRDSTGKIAGVYTKAFDAIHRSWQNYFIDAMMNLVDTLQIDGFRFDAPTYNDFPNWSESTRHRASASPLACVELFERMRPRFKEKNSDFLFYTEPSGHALRKSMDLNYNYDEQWLVTAVANPESRTTWGVNNGKELAEWFSDRDAMLPMGSLTAHHLDSHDTFWWPSWGSKWRREQCGLQITRALYVIFGSLPGPFMMFVGGEEGIVDLIKQISLVKLAITDEQRQHIWWLAPQTPPELFGLTYKTSGSQISILVNTSPNQITFAPEVNISADDTIIMSETATFHAGAIVLEGFGYLAVESQR
jgi:glycosidase